MFENLERGMDGQLMTERKMPVIALLLIWDSGLAFKKLPVLKNEICRHSTFKGNFKAIFTAGINILSFYNLFNSISHIC